MYLNKLQKRFFLKRIKPYTVFKAKSESFWLAPWYPQMPNVSQNCVSQGKSLGVPSVG